MSGRINSSEFLVGEWKGNNHWEDTSGHGNNGTVNGTEAYAENQFGGTFGDFDGTGDYVEVSAIAPEIDLGNKFSISVWFKADTTNADCIFCGRKDVSNRIGLSFDGSDLSATIYNNSATNPLLLLVWLESIVGLTLQNTKNKQSYLMLGLSDNKV